MSLSSTQLLIANVPSSLYQYTFFGAKPSEIAYLSGASSNITNQLIEKLSRTDNQTLGGNITCTTNPSGYTFIGALPSEVAYLAGKTSAIQAQLNGKQAACTYMSPSGDQFLGGNVTCLVNPNNYKFFGALPWEHAYLSGVSSAIQTQLTGK